MLRLASTSAPPLARLEIRDAALAADVTARCMRLDEHQTSRRGVAKIVGWSVAAAVSIVCVVLFGVPLAADRLAPLVPKPIERRIGDASEVQVKTIFGRKACEDPAGKAAFTQTGQSSARCRRPRRRFHDGRRAADLGAERLRAAPAARCTC